MVKYFPSKRDWWFGVIFWGLPFFTFFRAFQSGRWYDFIIPVIVTVFLMWVWFVTGYKIEGSTLYIQAGPFKRKVDINRIYSLKKSHTLWSSPALSLDRIEILYERDFRYAAVSPKHQHEFAKALLEINPRIQLDEKLKDDE